MPRDMSIIKMRLDEDITFMLLMIIHIYIFMNGRLILQNGNQDMVGFSFSIHGTTTFNLEPSPVNVPIELMPLVATSTLIKSKYIYNYSYISCHILLYI